MGGTCGVPCIALDGLRYGKEQEPCEGAGEAVVLSKQEAPAVLGLPEPVPRVQGLLVRPKDSHV